jgi:hypothetical protein
MVNLAEPTYDMAQRIAELEELSLAKAIDRALHVYLRVRADASVAVADPSRLSPEDLAVLMARGDITEAELTAARTRRSA